MVKDEIYKSFGTQTSKDGLKKSYCNYVHPITQEINRVYISWKRNEIKSERQAIVLLKDKIEKIYEDWQGNRVNEVKTFGDLFEVWYDEWVDTVRQTTVKSQLKVLNNIVFPAIPKELAISQMTKAFICNAWNKKILKIKAKNTGKLLAGGTLRKAKSIIRQITYYGYLNGYNDNLKFGKTDLSIPDNRFIEAESKRLKKWLTQEEVRQVISVIKEYYQTFNAGNNRFDTIYLDIVEFLTRTGLRIGELAALKDADVNFVARKLTVNKTLVSYDLRVEEYEINAPKTNSSSRIIDLDKRCVEILRKRIQYNRNRIEDVRKRDNGELYQEYMMKTGRNAGKVFRKKVRPRNNFVETDYIFQLQTGNPVNDSEFNRFINERRYTKTRCIREMLQERFPDWNKHISSHTFRYTHTRGAS